MDEYDDYDKSDNSDNECEDNNCEQNSELKKKNILWPNIHMFYEQQSSNASEKKKGNVSFQCILCKPKMKFISTSFTSNSNLRTHIKLVHSSKLSEFNKACKSNKLKETESEFNKGIEQRKINTYRRGSVSKIAFDQAVLKLIVNTTSPYSFVENNAFVEFCELFIKQKPITRKTLVSNLEAAYIKMKEQLIEKFKKVEYVSVTADLWTCFKRSYLGMTIHWLDSNTLERQSAGIACRRMQGRHTYDVLAEVIENILAEYQILDKTLHVITDNATNFAKAFRNFGQSETEKSDEINKNEEIIDLIEITTLLANNTGLYRLPPQHRCAAHTLNLVSTVDAKNAESDSNYKTISRRVFSKSQAIFNKQNQSSHAADLILKTLGKYLKVPNVTR